MNYLELILTTLGVIDQRWDAKYTAILEKQLEYVKAQTYDIVYPKLKARMLIPVSHEADTGAETITYRQWDVFGMAQIISNFADDLPLIDALSEEFTTKVKSIGAAYSYSLQDLRRSAMANANLPTRKASAARKAVEWKIESIGAIGESGTGLTGLANNANVPLVSPTTGTWSSATAAEIVADLNKLVNSIITTSVDNFAATTIVLPLALYTLIKSKPYTSTGDTNMTVLKFFLETNPEIDEVVPWNKLATANAAGTGARICAYQKDPEVLTMEIPQEFEQLPPQAKNLSFHVPCHARSGGVIWYYPIAGAYMDGC